MSAVGLQEWPSIVWGIADIFSEKRIESSEFTVWENKYSLLLEQNDSKDITKDCFSLSLKNMSYGIYNDFSVSTLVKDKCGKLQFLQHKNINSTQCISLIWKVQWRYAVKMRYWHTDTVSFILCFGPLSTIMQNTRLKPDKEEDKMIQTSGNFCCLETLSNNFRSLLDSHLESDATIKCEGCAFPVHKAILSSRSEVFAAMFQNDMQENRSGSVMITDLGRDVLKQLLNYIYTGTLPHLTSNTALLLYPAAHKYAIAALQRRCAQFMMENLSEDSACNCLVLAHVCNDSEFKNYVISFIIANKRILSSEEWMEMRENHLKLSVDVYDEYVKQTT